jgi:endonuclease/exonuclease/phosphatase family metal-dependent hydrolase
MRHRTLRLAGLLLFAAIQAAGCGSDDGGGGASPARLKVMTYNILCSFCDPRNYDPWAQRLPYFGDIFARHDPDLIGLQELTPLGTEVAQVRAQAPGYGAIYFAPPGEDSYPDALILYRESRFTVLDSGEYWLSPTPDVPRSVGFVRIQFPRLVVWARLLDMDSRRELFFASTHFDNNSPSQQLSAPLVKERTAPFVGDLPVIFVGDFNSRPNSTAYGILTGEPSEGFVFADSFDSAAWRIVSNQTPQPAYDVDDRIDHIFLAGDGIEWTVTDWLADLTVYGDKRRYPSDHFPVVATVEMRRLSERTD